MTHTRRRVLLKLSGEAIGGVSALHDHEMIQSLVSKIIGLSKAGMEVAIVCGGGNIRRYRDHISSGIDRLKSDHIGMMAWVINAIVLNERIIAEWGECVIYSAHSVSVPTMTNLYNAIKARNDLGKGRIVLCAWWTGSPYSTHDLAAVLRGLELQCDLVVKCTKVDGLYDKDPLKYTDAKRYTDISLNEVVARGLQVMDQSALALALDEKMPLYICQIDQIDRLMEWHTCGTLISVDKSAQ